MTTLPEYLDRTDVTSTVGTTPIPALQDYLGSAVAEQAILKAWYGAAIDWANTMLDERDFVDSAGSDEDPPDQAVIGVYEFVRYMRDWHARPSTGLKKVSTGARSEEYGDNGTGTMIGAMAAAWPHIELYVENPLLFSSGGV